MVVAPAVIAALTTSTKKLRSVLDASSGENSTLSQNVFANFTPSKADFTTASCVMPNLCSKCMSLVATKT